MRTREELEQIGCRILDRIRTELYTELRIMGPALDVLGYRMDLRTRTVGTDAAALLFNPNYLVRTYLEDPHSLTRTYVHILLHCLFGHPFVREEYEDRELFDLCADIAAEALADSIEEPLLYEVPTDFRESVYRELKEKAGVLTLPRLYRHFRDSRPDYDMRLQLAQEFRRDDHQFWEDLKEDPKDDSSRNGASRTRRDEWDDRRRNTKDMIAAVGKEASSEKGSLSWMLSFEKDGGTDYREFLSRFMTVREEVRIDPDGFDYAYYHFGLEMFGNMPLIEENEYREMVGIDQLVIAVDTSASTRQDQLEKFLAGTADLLASEETFFHHVHIHLIECDDQVQNDLLLTDVKELRNYADHFTAHGGMGTDFRPVFTYVDDLIRRGKLNALRGLMYFTDGYGTYPSEAAAYDTAFVFCRDEDYDDTHVPDWAMKLYI